MKANSSSSAPLGFGRLVALIRLGIRALYVSGKGAFLGLVALPKYYQGAVGKVRTFPIRKYSEEFSVEAGHVVGFSFETLSVRPVEGAALLKIELSSSDGGVVDIDEWPSRSRHVGNFVYVTPATKETPTLNFFSIRVPDNASTVRLSGVQWKHVTETRIVGDVKFTDFHSIQSTGQLDSGTAIAVSSRSLSKVLELDPGDSSIRVDIDFRLPEAGKASILKVEYLNDLGQPELPPSDLPQNPIHGSVIVLESKDSNPAVSRSNLSVPPEASFVRFEGVDWGPRTADLLADLRLSKAEAKADELQTFISEDSLRKPLIIIDTTAPPLGHATLALRPNNMSRAFERLGYAVVFIPFGSLQGFAARVSDDIFQIPRTRFDELIEYATTYRNPARSIYISSSFPSLQSVTAATRLRSAGWKTIYEVRDDMEEFNRVGYSKWYSPSLERHMLRTAEVVVSVSDALDEKLSSFGVDVANHFVVPNAVNRNVIRKSKALRSPQAASDRRGSKTVGYVGHLTPAWFDWGLIIKAAGKLPTVQFEIVGHGKPDSIRLPSNVAFLGPKTHDELPDIVSRWKTGLIPFSDQPLTRSVDPNKIYEYFAWGLNCVSAPMGRVHTYPFTWVYRNEKEFVEGIQSALDQEFEKQELATLERFVQSVNWDARAAEMKSIFDETSGS